MLAGLLPGDASCMHSYQREHHLDGAPITASVLPVRHIMQQRCMLHQLQGAGLQQGMPGDTLFACKTQRAVTNLQAFLLRQAQCHTANAVDVPPIVAAIRAKPLQLCPNEGLS